MKHLDLFSGIGGFALAASWVWGDEHEIVSFCEIDPFCQKVLKKHWPKAPIISDIRDVTYEKILADTESGGLDRRGWVEANDREESCSGRVVRNRGGGDAWSKADGQEVGKIDLLTGGFPCQPFSCAGKRQGERDDRFLWPELLRVIQEIKPKWCILENVPGLLSIDGGLVIDTVLDELEDAGYWAQTFKIGAFAVDAPHKRERLWIVAHGNGKRQQEQRLRVSTRNEKEGFEVTRSGQDVADTRHAESPGRNQIKERQQHGPGGGAWSKSAPRGLQRNLSDTQVSIRGRSNGKNNTGGRDKKTGGQGKPNRGVQHRLVKSRLGRVDPGLPRWLDEPDIPRVATGVKDRVNRLKAMGNAIVPQCVQPIMQAIKEQM